MCSETKKLNIHALLSYQQLSGCCKRHACHLHVEPHVTCQRSCSSCLMLNAHTCLSNSTVPEGRYSNSSCLISCQPSTTVALPYLSYSCSDCCLLTSVVPVKFPSKSYNCKPCNGMPWLRNLQHPSKITAGMQNGDLSLEHFTHYIAVLC